MKHIYNPNIIPPFEDSIDFNSNFDHNKQLNMIFSMFAYELLFKMNYLVTYLKYTEFKKTQARNMTNINTFD